MNQTTSVPSGRYRHYKGNEYTVLGVARHSETLEELVVYRQEYGERRLWVRPKSMFVETVTVDGQQVPRFRPMDSPSKEVLTLQNLYEELPQQLPQELIETLVGAPNIRIERIVSFGHASPEGFYYEQDQHEWVILLKGAARLAFEDARIEMKAGDFINIPAHRKHRVEWTTPGECTIWLAVFY